MKKIYLLLLIGVMAACAKDQPINNQVNRYFKSVRVISLPNLQYDQDGSPPDIRVDLKRRSTNFWEFSTETVNNAGSLPTFVNFPAEILATDEYYEITIMDEDLSQPADFEIFRWEFQAFDEGRNGEIIFTDNGIEIMALQYNTN